MTPRKTIYVKNGIVHRDGVTYWELIPAEGARKNVFASIQDFPDREANPIVFDEKMYYWEKIPSGFVLKKK